jgi:hypothetical protein
MKEKQKEIDDNQDDQVRLSPIMGVRPGVYLTWLYSIILIILIFLVLFLPGIRKPGVVLAVKTEPQGAAIRVDGVYMGTAVDKIFVPKGSHVIEAALPGFESVSSTHDIKGRVFGSLFFPKKYPIEFTLTTDDPAASFALAAADFAAWTFGPEPTAAWQIPLSLSEGAYRIGGAENPINEQILAAAARFTVTRAALRDIVRAKMLLDNNGNSPSPVTLFGSVSDILVFLSENSGSAQWLAGLLPPEAASVVEKSDWYKKEGGESDVLFPERGQRRVEVGGLSFFEILGKEEMGGFYTTENPVPTTIFENFRNSHSPLPTPYSLLPTPFSEFPARDEIVVVSWLEAEAFCKWLTAQLPSSMSGEMEVRLPTEAEWVYAAHAGIKIADDLWEWGSDPYAPLQFKAPDYAIRAVGSPEKLLITQDIIAVKRASLPPEFSSPFVTFRPVIAPKNSGF